MRIKPENYFFLKDGTRIKSLFGLSKELNKMPDDVFQHHVNENRNDFSSWIRYVLKDDKLAERLLSTTSREHIKNFIGERTNRGYKRYGSKA